MNLKKMMLAVMTAALVCPAVAQVTDLMRPYEDAAAMSKKYITEMQEELANRGIDNQAEDHGSYKLGFYEEMVTAAQKSLNWNLANEENLRAFAKLSNKFLEEMNVDPAQASMNQYKQFYNKYSNNPVLLVTIAIWKNHNFEGIAPYRFAGHPFWGEPEQAGGMYDTMAQIDPEKALGSLIYYIVDDFHATYPQFPEMADTDQTQEEYAHEYFTRFATMGKYAAKDANLLEQVVLEQLHRNVDAE